MPKLVEPIHVSRYAGLPKYMRVKLELAEELRGMAAETPLPSIAALQQRFSVSLATVDRALRELRTEGLVDVRHGTGSFATGRARTLQIGLCFGYDILEQEAGLYPRLLLKALGLAETRLETVECRHYFAAGTGDYWANKIRQLQQDVHAGLLDGVVVVGVYSEWLRDLGVPVVGLHSVPQATACVVLDYADLVRQGLRALAARGCRSVAFAGGFREAMPPEDDPTYAVAQDHQQARRAFLSEARKLGLVTHPEWLRGLADEDTDVEPGISVVELGGLSMFEAIRRAGHGLPDGIVSTDDYRTLGLCRAMAQHGLAEGRDIAVASLANLGSPTLDGRDVLHLTLDPNEVAGALLETVSGLIIGREAVAHRRFVKGHVQ